MQQAGKVEREPVMVPQLLVHGVGVRVAILDYGQAPRLAEVCKKTRHGFELAHEGTTFHINTTKHPNVWFHVSVIVQTKDCVSGAVRMKALQEVQWLESRLGIFTSYAQTELDETWNIRSVYVPVEVMSVFTGPFALPGKLSETDLDRLAGEYPEPVPGSLVLPKRPGMLDEDEQKAIVQIIRKYSEWSFKEMCERWAAHDEDGGCAELCQGKPDEAKCPPECCPVVDFRNLVRVLTKAFPHDKRNPPFGGYY